MLLGLQCQRGQAESGEHLKPLVTIIWTYCNNIFIDVLRGVDLRMILTPGPRPGFFWDNELENYNYILDVNIFKLRYEPVPKRGRPMGAKKLLIISEVWFYFMKKKTWLTFYISYQSLLVFVHWGIFKIWYIKTEFLYHVFVSSALIVEKCFPISGRWHTTSVLHIPRRCLSVTLVTK